MDYYIKHTYKLNTKILIFSLNTDDSLCIYHMQIICFMMYRKLTVSFILKLLPIADFIQYKLQ